MATDSKIEYTYANLERFPEDNLRREIIDGDLIVTAAPARRHQHVVMTLAGELYQYVKGHGGRVFPAPTDVFFSDTNVVEPDVLFIRPEHAGRVERKFIRSAPDVVVEVSSPSTRRLELVRKRALYERFGVPEYWYVDLDADRAEVYSQVKGAYGPPRILGRGDVLESPQVPSFALAVADLLGPPEED